MKIGHFVSVVSRLRGYERNVSGHIQIPLHAMQLLADRGHDVHLITNSFGEDRVLPWCMPNPVTVHYVRDSRRRQGALEQNRIGAITRGVYPVSFVRQLLEMKSIVQTNEFDLLHLHGHSRTAQLGALLRCIGLNVPTVVSLSAAFSKAGAVSRTLLRRSGPVVVATEHAANRCRESGLDATTIRHGVVRNFAEELPAEFSGERTRVLYWRDLTLNNGGDLCLKAFDELAPRFPDVRFTIAVRPSSRELDGVDDLESKHPNIDLYRFPYPDGISLAQLIFESICVVLPFRSLSVHPQLAIAESLAVGVPVLASDLQSNSELVEDGHNGRLVPVGDADATVVALQEMLEDREKTAEMGRNAAEHFAQKWTWTGYAEALEKVYERAMSRRGTAVPVTQH